MVKRKSKIGSGFASDVKQALKVGKRITKQKVTGIKKIKRNKK